MTVFMFFSQLIIVLMGVPCSMCVICKYKIRWHSVRVGDVRGTM